MAEITKVRRLVNPGRRKRRMSLLQKLHFGTARVRAAAQRMLKGKRKANRGGTSRALKQSKRTTGHYLGTARARYKRLRSERRYTKRHNIGSIVTVFPLGGNPGRRRRRTSKYKSYYDTKTGTVRRRVKGMESYYDSKTGTVKHRRKRNKGGSMAKTRRRRRVSYHRRRPRRRNVVYRRRIKRGRYEYSSNPRRRRRHYNRRSRRRNPSMRRRHHRRRNPAFGGFLTGTGGSVVGVLSGLALTKFLVGFLPATFQTGVLGYVGIGAVAVLQGKLVGKFTRMPSFGHYMMVGGLAYLLNKVLQDFLPSIGGYTGVSGIGGSSFYTPQVPLTGNMGAFVLPSAVTGALAAPTANVGRVGMGVARRTGRLM